MKDQVSYIEQSLSNRSNKSSIHQQPVSITNPHNYRKTLVFLHPKCSISVKLESPKPINV